MVLESLGLAGGVAEECEEDTGGGGGAKDGVTLLDEDLVFLGDGIYC